jgi:flagellar assembly factor FliW
MKTAEQTELEMPVLAQTQTLQMPLGLLGFEPIKQYLCVESPEEAPFCWLQAVNEPGLTFLVIPPFEVLSDYQPNISDEDVAFLELASPADARLLTIVTLRGNGRATANLKGPIVVNRRTNRAKQVVLSNAAEYPLQFPLPQAD